MIYAIGYAAAGFVLGGVLTAALSLWRQVALREKLARLEIERESFDRQISQHKADLKDMQEMFSNKFENLSNRIFDEKSEKFKKQSRESLDQLLNPLREKLTEFHKKVDDSFGKQAAEQFSLKEQIKNIIEAHGKITLQAENLTNALKGESKTQGDWGEIVLEKILEDSGLRKDIDYIAQGREMGLRSRDTGNVQRPDITVFLPEKKHIIIDSKVSLTHYERFWSESDAAVRAGHLKQFIESVRNHVRSLEQSRYQDLDKLGTPNFVLMFMPIEGAYMVALQQDPELQRDAWNKNVIMVGPTNLLATLRTIASLWRLVRQNQNAQEIAKQGGALYDKVESFVKDLVMVGTQLSTVGKTYEKAMTKLSGRGGILRRTEMLKELGATTSKALPSEMISDMTGLEAESLDETPTDEDSPGDEFDQKTGTN